MLLHCADSGERVDVWVARGVEGMTRSRAQRLIADGQVAVNGEPAQKSYIMKAGDVVDVDIPPPQDMSARAEPIGLSVVYEDRHIIVVDKPQGMVVHPANGNWSGTLVNALLHHCAGGLSDINGVVRPGIVHRLDKGTSGLVVAAKTNEAHLRLCAAFKAREVRKAYLAVVRGHVAQGAGVVDLAVGRSAKDRKKMAAYGHGGPGGQPPRGARDALSRYRVVERLHGAFGRLTLVEVEIYTGRTHQIRVHLAAIGHPVLGDAAYGGAAACPPGARLAGQLLHASALELAHPATGEPMRFKSPLPERFAPFLKS